MPRRCTICTHKARPKIDKALVERQAFRVIAGQYGVSKSALVRRHDDHLPAALVKAQAATVAVSGGRLILMSTPHGKRGHFHEAWKDGGPEWLKIEVKALDCPRISEAFLETERREIGDLWFRQEYGCEFLETIDQVFRYDDIERALSDDVEPLFGATTDNQAGDVRSLLGG